MPTAAKLVAAVLLAVLAWYVSDLIKPHLREGRPTDGFSELAAAMGAIVGWVFTGRRLDRGLGSGTGIGLASVALVVFWTGLGTSLYEMVMRSTNRRYSGPMDAIKGMVQIFIDDLKAAAQIDVLIALVVGGALVGIAVRWVAARYK